MKKRTLTVLVVVLVCTFLTACSKEIDTVTESVNEKESTKGNIDYSYIEGIVE